MVSIPAGHFSFKNFSKFFSLPWSSEYSASNKSADLVLFGSKVVEVSRCVQNLGVNNRQCREPWLLATVPIISSPITTCPSLAGTTLVPWDLNPGTRSHQLPPNHICPSAFPFCISDTNLSSWLILDGALSVPPEGDTTEWHTLKLGTMIKNR